MTGTRLTLIKSGTNGFEIANLQRFCGTKPRRLDDFLVPDVSVKGFLILFSLRGICRVSFVSILVLLVYVLVSGFFFFGFFIPSLSIVGFG